MSEESTDAPNPAGLWRWRLALAAGVAAFGHGVFTIFDDQHNGGAGTELVVAALQIGAVHTRHRGAALCSIILALLVAGRAGVRFYLGAALDWPGLLVALAVMVAGVFLRNPSPSRGEGQG